VHEVAPGLLIHCRGFCPYERNKHVMDDNRSNYASRRGPGLDRLYKRLYAANGGMFEQFMRKYAWPWLHAVDLVDYPSTVV